MFKLETKQKPKQKQRLSNKDLKKTCQTKSRTSKLKHYWWKQSF